MNQTVRWSSDQGIFPQTVRAQALKALEKLSQNLKERNKNRPDQAMDTRFVFHFHYCLSKQSPSQKKSGEIYIRILPESEIATHSSAAFEEPNQAADYVTSGNLSVTEWQCVLDLLVRYSNRVESIELSEISTTIGKLMENLKEDLSLLEGLHRSRLPKRFPQVKGMQVRSRYLAGLKPGGDFFDLAESEDGMRLHFVLTDASSYSLSSAVLSVLMRVALKVAPGEGADPSQILKRISGEMFQVMKEKENLSICFGSISRKDWKLRLVHHGTNRVFHLSKGPNGGDHLQEIVKPSVPLKKAALENAFQEMVEIDLNPQDCLLLLSDGWEEATGGEEALREALQQAGFGALRTKASGASAPQDSAQIASVNDLEDGLTALVYEVKRRRSLPDDMPAQDCSALVIQLDSRLLKLAPN